MPSRARAARSSQPVRGEELATGAWIGTDWYLSRARASVYCTVRIALIPSSGVCPQDYARVGLSVSLTRRSTLGSAMSPVVPNGPPCASL